MNALKTDDFDYHLPEELIAQRPPAERDGGRLMHLPFGDGAPEHLSIRDLPRLVAPGTLLVVNDSRVVPARLRARRPTGGQVEVLLIEPVADDRWLVMLRASKRPKPGERLAIEGAEGLEVQVARLLEGGRAEVSLPLTGVELAERHGAMPLPPYIRREADAEDRARYQTVYANQPGSIAAPTAGLHLSQRVLDGLRAAGVEIAAVTLHVGPGTFVPVRADRVADHEMESERLEVGEQTAGAVARAKREGRPVVAVGTTAVRALEGSGGRPGARRTELFITPGYRFAVVDGLLTNFHLPRSTLLMLVSALAGRERVIAAYREAVAERYRFYSYGDAMLLAPWAPKGSD